MATKKKGSGKKGGTNAAYRILALILTLLMIGGAIFTTVYMIFATASAAEVTDSMTFNIGLMYGSDAPESFRTSAVGGFSVGRADTEADVYSRSYEELWSTDTSQVAVTLDANLYKDSTNYGVNNSTSRTTVIGGYHLEVQAKYNTKDALMRVFSNVVSYLEGTSYYAFPAYIGGSYRIRIGDFSSEETASRALSKLSYLDEFYPLQVAAPDSDVLSVINWQEDDIIFEYESDSNGFLALRPQKDGEKTKTVNNNIYKGVFVYRRRVNSSLDGITVVNMLPLEDYVEGVLPGEISASWPQEAQRTFAICIRTYAVQNIGKHYKAYGFDLCNSTNCQFYGGCTRVKPNVTAAVESTKGLVLSYKGDLAKIYYTAISGGETLSVSQAWGGKDDAYPYMPSIKTPWEQYSDYTYGLWKSEVSASELASYLRGKGYTQLTGSSIRSIKVNSYAGDTSYIYSMTITDSNGRSVTINTCDSVRTALSAYVKSSNFSVGIGKVDYSYDVVVDMTFSENGAVVGPTGPAFPDFFDSVGQTEYTVVTADGNESVASDSEYAVALTSFGRRAIMSEEISVMSSGKHSELVELIESGKIEDYYAPSEPQLPSVSTGQGTINAMTKTVTTTYYASSSNNFIFAGRGWGHGVGISQYGTLNLANAGVRAEMILSTYFPGTQILPYSEIK